MSSREIVKVNIRKGSSRRIGISTNTRSSSDTDILPRIKICEKEGWFFVPILI